MNDQSQNSLLQPSPGSGDEELDGNFLDRSEDETQLVDNQNMFAFNESSGQI